MPEKPVTAPFTTATSEAAKPNTRSFHWTRTGMGDPLVSYSAVELRVAEGAPMSNSITMLFEAVLLLSAASLQTSSGMLISTAPSTSSMWISRLYREPETTVKVVRLPPVMLTSPASNPYTVSGKSTWRVNGDSLVPPVELRKASGRVTS